MGGHGARDVAAGHDVLLALDGEQLEHLGDLEVLDGEVDLAERVHLHGGLTGGSGGLEEVHGLGRVGGLGRGGVGKALPVRVPSTPRARAQRGEF